jgi:hypothetical protein
VSTTQQEDSGIGAAFVGVFGIIVVTTGLLVAVVADLVALGASWPLTGANAPQGATAVNLLDWSFSASIDQRLFLTVSLSGALGGLLHGLRSLYWYIGNRALRRSWLTMYLCLPFVGSAMAVVFYLVLRGGLVPGGGGSDVNAFGFAAVSALVGLFSSQAAEKLRQIFATLLTPAESGKDTVTAPAKPRIRGLEPTEGAAGTTVRITGTRLDAATEVLFGDAATPVVVVSSGEVTAVVPDQARSAAITMKVGDRILAGPRFEVTG